MMIRLTIDVEWDEDCLPPSRWDWTELADCPVTVLDWRDVTDYGGDDLANQEAGDDESDPESVVLPAL